jgi:hypothetical protein
MGATRTAPAVHVLGVFCPQARCLCPLCLRSLNTCGIIGVTVHAMGATSTRNSQEKITPTKRSPPSCMTLEALMASQRTQTKRPQKKMARPPGGLSLR